MTFLHHEIPEHILEPIQKYVCEKNKVETENGNYPCEISIGKNEVKSDYIYASVLGKEDEIPIGDISHYFKELRKELPLDKEMYQVQSALAFLTHLDKLEGCSKEDITKKTDIYIGEKYLYESDFEREEELDEVR